MFSGSNVISDVKLGIDNINEIYQGTEKIWSRATPYYAGLLSVNWTFDSLTQYKHAVQTYRLTNNCVEVEAKKYDDENMVESAKALLTATFPTKGCNKVRLKVWSTHFSYPEGSANYSGSVCGKQIYPNNNYQYFYFDCPGDTFPVSLYASDGTGYFTCVVQLHEIYFYYE